MTPLAAYLLLFVAVGVGFIFVHLVAGKLIRPARPEAEKGTIYECGEPTIGSAWIQFDLRFYVVALLFVIFDVEVAFFFPWAEVFGKANAIVNVPGLRTDIKKEERKDTDREVSDPKAKTTEVTTQVVGFATAAEYREAAARIFDLAAPTATSGLLERERWEALRNLTQENFEGFQTFSAEEIRNLITLTPWLFKAYQETSKEQREVLKQESAALTLVIKGLREERLKAFQPILNKIDARGQEAIYDELKLTNTLIRNASLMDLEEKTILFLPFLKDPIAGDQLLALKIVKAENAQDSLQELARKQENTLQEAVRKTLAAFKAAGLPITGEMTIKGTVRTRPIWGSISPGALPVLVEISSDPTKNNALQGLRHSEIAVLGDPDVKKTLEQAREISILALMEILVFFGVLLVGFAYLWKRGDINWVRSTAAERQEELGSRPDRALPMPTLELESSGKGS